MPVVQIHLYKGRDKETKENIAKAVTKAIAETAGTQESQVKIIFNDMEFHDYAIGGEFKKDPKSEE